MFAAAIGLGEAARYQSAGSAEFIYDNTTAAPDFLEVNTRLQVEHGVTEEVTGIDLVEWMLRIASGERLSGMTHQADGHSIEVRIYAEDPGKNFQPSAGLLTEVKFPADARIETWVECGTEVTPFYDPLLAKVIVRSATRDDALAKLRTA